MSQPPLAIQLDTLEADARQWRHLADELAHAASHARSLALNAQKLPDEDGGELARAYEAARHHFLDTAQHAATAGEALANRLAAVRTDFLDTDERIGTAMQHTLLTEDTHG